MNSESAILQSLLNKGHAALWDHDWDEAVAAYTEALVESPDHPLGLSSLGLAYFHQKRFRESLEIFQQLSEQNPADPMPMERISRIHERQGMLQEAIASYSRAAELQLKALDIDRSIADYQEILRLDPENQEARTRLAMIYNKLNRVQDAITEFIDLAAVVQHSGNPVKAQQILEYAQKINPDSIEIRNALVTVRDEKPLAMIERKADRTGALRMAQVREMDRGEEVEGGAGVDATTETRQVALKEIAGLLFEDVEASRARDIATSLSPGEDTPFENQLDQTRDRRKIQHHISECIDRFTAGQNDEAAVDLEQAVDHGLNHQAANFLLGYLVNQKDQQKALKFLQKSVRSNKYALASYLLIGDIFYKTGQLKEASLNYLHALKLADGVTVAPEEVDELYQLYDPIFESQSYITQEKDLRNLCTVIHAQLTRPDWCMYLKAARQQLPPQAEGNPPLPLAEMLIDSTSSQIVDSLAEVRQLASEGKYRTAMEEAFRSLTYAPTYLPLHIQIGEILVNEGRIPEAIEKFSQVSRLYTIRGDTPQAIRLLHKVTRLAPMDIDIRHRLIHLLKTIGRDEDVIQQYVDLANAHYLLADLDRSREAYHSALKISRQSIATREWSVKILNRLADVELQSLNWKEAVRVFEQLRSLQPMESIPRTALVDLYLKLGLSQPALNEVDAYIQLLESSGKSGEIEGFLDRLVIDNPHNTELPRRLAKFYARHDDKETAVKKLDALAEKLLVEKHKEAALPVIALIIDLDPPNRADYETLYKNLEK